jgi:hypothetical protein
MRLMLLAELPRNTLLAAGERPTEFDENLLTLFPPGAASTEIVVKVTTASNKTNFVKILDMKESPG